MSSPNREKLARTTTFLFRRSRVLFRWCLREGIITSTELAHRAAGDSAPAVGGGVSERGGHRGKLRERPGSLARIPLQSRLPGSPVDKPRHFGLFGFCFSRNRGSARVSPQPIRGSRPSAAAR